MSQKISNLNNKYFNIFFLLIYIILPFGIVSGPAIPDILISITAIVFILLTLFNKKLLTYFNKQIFIIIFIFWSYLIICSFLSDYSLFSLKSSFLYLRFFLFLLIFSIIIQYNKIVSYHYYLFFLLFIFLFIDSGIQFLTGQNLLGYKIIANRASSLFLDELILGNFIYTFYPLVFFFIFRNININFIFKFIIFSLTLIVPILFTGERISLIKSLVLILLIGFFFLNLRLYLIYIVAFLSLILIIVFSQPELKNRFYDDFKLRVEFTKNKSFLDSHWGAIYLTSYNLFKNNKLIGIGPNNYRNECDLNDIKKSKEYIDLYSLKKQVDNHVVELKRSRELKLLFRNNLPTTKRNNFILKDTYEKIISTNSDYRTYFYIIGQNDIIEGYYNFKNFLPYDNNNNRIYENYINFDEYNNTVDIKSNSWTIACSTHPHHLILQILSETGFVGFLIFIYLIFNLIKYLILSKNSNNSIFIFIGVVYAINSINPLFTYSNFFNNNTSIFLWFFILELIIIINFLKIKNEPI